MLPDGGKLQDAEDALLEKVLLGERAAREDVMKFFATVTLFPKGVTFFESCKRMQILRGLAEANEEAAAAYLGVAVNFTSKARELVFPPALFHQMLDFGQTCNATASVKAIYGAFLSNLSLMLVHGFLVDLCSDLVQRLLSVLKREYEHPELAQDALVSLAVLIMGCKSAKLHCVDQGIKGVLEPYLGLKAQDMSSFAHAILQLLEHNTPASGAEP